MLEEKFCESVCVCVRERGEEKETERQSSCMFPHRKAAGEEQEENQWGEGNRKPRAKGPTQLS